MIETNEIEKNLRKCLDNISENLGHPFHIGDIYCDSRFPFSLTVPIEIKNMTTIELDKYEITSAKDYKKLHNLVEQRVIGAIYEFHELTGEFLQSLGALDNPHQPPDERDSK